MAQLPPLPPSPSSRFILVTGGLGYIGSHTTVEILKKGHNVIIIDNLSNCFNNVYDNVEKLATRHYKKLGKTMPFLRFYNIDYRDPIGLRKVLDTYTPTINGVKGPSQIMGVIHFAASKSVPESISQPLKYYMNNVSGLIEFCDILGTYAIKNLVFSSSAAVYGGLADKVANIREEMCVHHPETYVDDDGKSTTTEPGCFGLTSPYSRTKYMCEAILADLAASDPSWNIIALRYFNPVSCDSSGVLGERARGVPTNLLPVVTSVLTGEKPFLNVFGDDYNTRDGSAVRDFIHVSDLALGHIAALDAMADGKIQGKFRTFNLGSSTGHSVLEVIAAMEKISGKKIAYRLVGRREGDLPSCVAKNTRASKELGWTTTRSLDDAAKDLYNYLVLNNLMNAVKL
jgi:UDP-glucose 4-epimerase